MSDSGRSLELAGGRLRVSLSPTACVEAVVGGPTELLLMAATAPCWRVRLRKVGGPARHAPSAAFTGPSGPWWQEYLAPEHEISAAPVVDGVRTDERGTTWTAASLLSGDGVVDIATSLFVGAPGPDGSSAWRVRIDNTSTTHVVVALDVLPFGQLRSIADDVLLMPFWGGDRLPDAARSLKVIADATSGSLHAGSPRVVRQAESYLYALPYAGSASMPWLYYEQDGIGLYLAQHDPSARMMQLRATAQGQGLELGLQLPCDVGPRERWSSPRVVIAGHVDGWHGAATRYRTWWDTAFPPPIAADSWSERSGLQITFLKTADGRMQQRFSDLPALLDELKPLGLDMLAPYGWSQGGFDSYNPDFYPDLELGGPSAMAASYADIRSRDGEVMGYLNGRLFSHRSSYHPRLGLSCAAKQEDRSLNTEHFGGSDFSTSCPGSSEWRELIAGFAEMLVGSYGVRCIFLDQLAACPPLDCHDTHHLHNTCHDWNAMTVGMAGMVLERCRTRDPAVALAVEGVSDILAPYALVQSYVSLYAVGHDYKFPELFAFTFPETVLADTVPYVEEPDGSLYPGIGALPVEMARHWICRGTAIGAWFGVMDQTRVDSQWWSEVGELLALRHAAGAYLAGGRFNDTVDVIAAPPGLRVTTTIAAEGSVLCVVHALAGPAAGTIELRWPHATVAVSQVSASGLVATDATLQAGRISVLFDAKVELLQLFVLTATP